MANPERPSGQGGQVEAGNQVEPGKVAGFIERNRGKLGLVIGALVTNVIWSAVLKARSANNEPRIIAADVLVCAEDPVLGVRQCLKIPLEALQKSAAEGCPDTDNPLPSMPTFEELCPDIRLDDTSGEKPAAEESQRI